MFKKWRPSKRMLGAIMAIVLVIVLTFSFGYIVEMLSPKSVAPQTVKQYDSPKTSLDFHVKEEKQEELKVTFSEERKKQNFNKQMPLSFEKKAVESKENESNFQGALISGLLIVMIIGGIGAVLYTQWRNAKQSDEIGGM